MIGNRSRKIFEYQWFFLFLFVVLISLVAESVNRRYFWLANISNLLGQISVLSLAACGATILIVAGEIDISIGANIGLSTVVMAVLMRSGWNSSVAALVGVVVATSCASAVGAASILFHAPSFIVSLACIGVFQGIALFITQGTLQTIYGQFESLASLKLFNFLPLLFVIAIAGYIITHLILAHTQLGRSVYAVGNNPRAAYLAGINIKRQKLIFFALNGLFVGIASMLLLSRVGAAQPSTGTGIELQAIGSVVIGGAPMTGGKGDMIGTFFGVLLWGVIGNALNMMQVNAYVQDVIFGVLIVFAVALSSLRLRTQTALMQ